MLVLESRILISKHKYYNTKPTHKSFLNFTKAFTAENKSMRNAIEQQLKKYLFKKYKTNNSLSCRHNICFVCLQYFRL